MAQVFISYSRKDMEFVENLRQDLGKSHLSVWIDHEGLEAGTSSWELGIRAALEEAHTVLWIVSPGSFGSPYVRDEIAIARMKGKRIIPVWMDGDNWHDCVPLGTGEIQHINMRGAAYSTGLEKLLKALTGDHHAAAALSVPKEVAPSLPAGTDPRNPYKGLNAFTQADAGDFFGRSTLIDDLQRMVEARIASGERFLAVLGPSGAGKSSVVMAGLLPKLGAEWRILPRVVPGKRPLENLADALHSVLGGSLAALEQDLSSGAKYLSRLARSIGKRALLYIDQFEEVFTQSAEEERQRFIDLLTYAASDPDGSLFIVLSMRADFYDRPMHYGTLGALIARNQASVLPMSISELYEAIQKPALLPDVGLTFEDGLVSEIVFELRARNAALEGALPFLEFTLTRLYEAREGTRLTRRAYDAMGGVEGAIGNHADALFAGIAATYGTEAEAALGRVFLPLTNIDLENGKATRRRAAQSNLPSDPAAAALWQAFVTGRLLQTGSDKDGVAYIEVAHEALLRSWERLKGWIASAQEDLILLRQVRAAAHDWQTKGYPDFLLWQQERLMLVYAMQERLKPELNEVEQDFIEPEQARLLRELETLPHDDSSHERRRDIGDRLAVIGDTRPGVGVKDGLPDIVWLPVAPGGEIVIGGQAFTVQPFYVAKYLVTYAQFQAFVDAEDGFDDLRWWEGMPNKDKRQELSNQRTKMKNAPRDSVSWYQAVAFSRWMNHRYLGLALPNPGDPASSSYMIGENAEIRLPTEWEWQWMAQGGFAAKAYPWGDWQVGYANTSEAGLSRATAVGMYPHGAVNCGALDVTGNLREWCLNDYVDYNIVDIYSNRKSKVLRGGSFHHNQILAVTSYRNNNYPINSNDYSGLRFFIAPISALTRYEK